MRRLGQRLHKRRLGTAFAGVGPTRFFAKGYTSGLFLGMAILFVVSGVKSHGGIFALLVLWGIGLMFLAVSVMVALEKRSATRMGYVSIGAFCIFLLYNMVAFGTFGMGLLWLIVAMFAVKKLLDYDSYLSQKNQKL